MNRGWIVYILMFVFAAAGLWVILILGRAANAPDDVSGTWTVEWITEAPPQGEAPGEASRMDVSQSGRFFMVRFGQREPIRLTLEPEWIGKRSGRQLKMKLSGELWRMELRGDIPYNERYRIPEVHIELAGPTRHVGIARRERQQTVGAPAESAPESLPAPETAPAADARS